MGFPVLPLFLSGIALKADDIVTHVIEISYFYSFIIYLLTNLF